MEIIDYQCHCRLCEARTQRTYLLSVTCANCGERHVAKLRHGDKPSWLQSCPYCGTNRLHFGTTAEAKEWLHTDA